MTTISGASTSYFMTPRQDEKFARIAFDRFLESLGVDSRMWSPGADPPDFDLTIGPVVYPVEVAQLMVNAGPTGHERTEAAWVKGLERIARDFEAEMTRLGVLNGSYALHLEPVTDPRTVANSVRSDIANYLRATAAETTAGSLILWRGINGGEWSIEKVGASTNMLAPTMTVGGSKRWPEIIADIEQMISSELTDKRYATRRLIDVILLLIDAYSYANEDDWKSVARRTDFRPFHTVARIYHDHRCQILHSINPSWLGTG